MRKQMGQTAKKWWLFIHLLSVAGWFGISLALAALLMIGDAPTYEVAAERYATVKILDDFILIPSASLVVVTGLVLALYTHWGLTKYYWVFTKFVVTMILVLGGTFYLAPLLNQLIALNETGWIGTLSAAVSSAHFELLVAGIIQIVLLFGIIIISVFKPWGKRATTQKEPS